MNKYFTFSFIFLTIGILGLDSVIVTSMLDHIVCFALSPLLEKMLIIFIVIMPILLLMCLGVAFFLDRFSQKKEDNLTYQKMRDNETKDRQINKEVNYGLLINLPKNEDDSIKHEQILTYKKEEDVLDEYIRRFMPFLRKNIKVTTEHASRYFDAYANWNGCNYVVEVKRIKTWTQSCLQGVSLFTSNARNSFPIVHMTLILQLEETCDKENIVKQIHVIEPALNVVFASEDSTGITFSIDN